MMIRSHSALALSLGMFALALLAPVAANAQTIYHVRVTVTGTTSTATYCDTRTPCPNGIQLWDLSAAGTNLSGGKTLVLSQTGPLNNNGQIAGNFDTSDRVTADASGKNVTNIDVCSPTHSLCTVTIDVDTAGSGILTNVYTDTVGDPLDAFNKDTGSIQEEQQWGSAVYTAANYTLRLGYADNAHGCVSNCLPNPFDGSGGTTPADFPKAAGTESNGTCSSNCFDGGALLFTGINVTPPACTINNVTIANTSWNSFNVPSGKSAVVWFNAHIGTPSGIPTNTTTQVLFTNGTLTVDGSTFNLPTGQMIFDPAHSGPPTTTYNSVTNTWTTTVNPNNLSDELFFDGDAIPVTAALQLHSQATVSFTVQSTSSNFAFNWQWSAAVYTFWPTDWNQADILAYHHSDHAGTPLNQQVQQSLIQGPRGGGGSNFTGSWSATGTGTCR